MSTYIKYSLVIFCLALLCCKRQDIVSPYSNYVNVPISVDWSESVLTDDYAQSMSVYFFPQSGDEPYLKITGSVDSTNMQLPAGEYSVLIFNDFVSDLSGINFTDETNYNEFGVSAISSENTDDYFADLVDSDEMIATVSNRLAAWRLDSFTVYQQGCGYCDSTGSVVTSSESLLEIKPTPVTVQNTINIRVENLDNASVIVGTLRGSAISANLATNQRNLSTSSDYLYTYTFQSRVYDDSSNPVDGVVSATLTTFGKQPTDDASYELELSIILSSGEQSLFTRDVTTQVESSEEFNIIINLTDSNNLISLPESRGIGFGVDSWGDSEDLNLI